MATKVKSFRLDKDKEKFIQRALDWYDIIQKMIAFGSIKEIPDIFVFPQHTIVPESHAVSEPEQIIPQERLVRAAPAEKVGISVEDFLAKHPVKNQEPQQKTEFSTPVDDLPGWLYSVMTGSFPPPPEENTTAQNKMFDDKEFQAVCKEYEKSHDPELIKVARDIAERCGVEL